jgi:hypothetical protein
MEKCEVCRAQVRELRRGRCWGCYSRWAAARPVGLGAVCRICGERRRSYLKSMELLGSWCTTCHTCAGLVAKLDPMPTTVLGVREALRRDRRQTDRRGAASDGRSPSSERRGGDRRLERRRTSRFAVPGARSSSVLSHEPCEDDLPLVDDEMVVEIAELASELESLAHDLGEVADLTRIHDLGR